MKLLERERIEPKWAIPNNLFGHEVLILGNGPSLSSYSLSNLLPWTSVIAVNDAFLRAPRADVLYFSDQLWWKESKERVNAWFEGKTVITRTYINVRDRGRLCDRFRLVDRAWGCDLSKSPSHLAGFDSGSAAINLAYLGGAKRILLLGFDMRPGKWHRNKYPDDCPTTHYGQFFLPSHRGMAKELAATDCEVVNITPDSALDCYPSQRPEAFGIVRNDR